MTLSVSAPSDNTNMSVSFVNSEYPYATYANGTLTVNINMDKQYNSETDFQNAINDALNAGGVTLPDDVEILFEFESIPNNPEAVAATNTVTWTYSSVSGTTSLIIWESGFCPWLSPEIPRTCIFSTPQVPTTAQVELNYDAGAAVGTAPVVNYDRINCRLNFRNRGRIIDSDGQIVLVPYRLGLALTISGGVSKGDFIIVCMGNLSDVTIQQDGTIIGYHAVHGYMDLGRIDIATFDNPNGLSQIKIGNMPRSAEHSAACRTIN